MATVWLLCGYCAATATSDGTANKENVQAISAAGAVITDGQAKFQAARAASEAQL